MKSLQSKVIFWDDDSNPDGAKSAPFVGNINTWFADENFNLFITYRSECFEALIYV